MVGLFQGQDKLWLITPCIVYLSCVVSDHILAFVNFMLGESNLAFQRRGLSQAIRKTQ